MSAFRMIKNDQFAKTLSWTIGMIVLLFALYGSAAIWLVVTIPVLLLVGLSGALIYALPVITADVMNREAVRMASKASGCGSRSRLEVLPGSGSLCNGLT